MNRKTEKQLKTVKHYFRDGEFRHDFWRVWAPIVIVAALAIFTCWSDIVSVFQ